MMHGNVPEYQLAEKMKSRFSGRGEAVSGMRASTTSELMRRAQMGGDPSVNCSELDFRRAAQAQNRGARPQYANNPAVYGTPANRSARPQPNPAPQNRGSSERRTENAASARPAGSGQNASGTRIPSGHPADRAGNGKNVKTAGTPANPGKAPAPKKKKKTVSAKPKKAKKKRLHLPPMYAAGEIAEVKVRGRQITPMFAVFWIVGTMMIMSIVLSFSEIYQTTSEIAKLESEIAVLRDQAAELELKLEEKNDIRIIEQIATEELGMVKEDAVQRKYISLSDGERIDIIEDESENESAHGILLSSIWSSLGSLFDYFR